MSKIEMQKNMNGFVYRKKEYVFIETKGLCCQHCVAGNNPKMVLCSLINGACNYIHRPDKKEGCFILKQKTDHATH